MSGLSRRPLAVVTDDRFGDGLALERAVLGPAGVEVVEASCATSVEVAAACRDADAVLANLAPVDAAALAAMERCVVVARYGVGLDSVDLAAAAARGVAVRNVPGYCDTEVAEEVIGLILALARRIAERDAYVRAGGWNLPAANRRVAGSILGVVGFGGTGKALARAALGLGFSAILVHSRRVSAERLEAALGPAARALGVRVEAAGLDELLGRSDWVSLHLPLVSETRGLMDGGRFAAMKEGASFVNTSRGGLVDEGALAAALRSGRLAGAGLDVFSVEPLPADSPLRGLPNLVFSDHSAYASRESVAELRRRTAQNALEELARAGRLPPRG
ncbi:MAG: C-terminal binding protein [Spirochaetaceae bacterium]|nr:C-terminal binding protein [Spirochaetaceae bacterium]